MLSLQTSVSDGTLQSVPLAIDFIDTSHIHVYRSDIETELVSGVDYIWDGDTIINLITVVPVGVVLVILRRTVYSTMLNTFTGGSPFLRTTLDENFQQVLFIAQESAESGITLDYYRSLNMHQNTITNLREPTTNTDAATKNYADTIVATLKSYVDTADTIINTRLDSLENQSTTGAISYSFVATGGETQLTPPYTFNSAELIIDGVLQTPVVDFTVVANVVYLVDFNLYTGQQVLLYLNLN